MRPAPVGGPPEQPSERPDSTAVGVDDEYAYAADFFDSRLYAVPLDGSALPTVLEHDLLMRDHYTGRLVSDGSTVYYGTSRGIWRRPPDRRAELVAPVQVRSLALDGDLLVWVTADTVGCLALSAL